MTSPERNLGLPDVIDGWFRARGWQPRPHQLALSATVQAGHDALLIAPTGGGKTLAGFLPSLTALQNKSQNPTGRPGIHTLYLSPLKALAVDVARNVEQPVMEMGLDIRIETRTGDTPVSKRNRQRQNPPDILLTTPEQLALLLAAGNAASFFADLRYVIIDEIHAMAASKRGDLLSLGLAALASWSPDCRFIGLSATVREPAHLQAWLGVRGSPAQLVMADGGAEAEIDILLPDQRIPWSGHSGRFAVADIYRRLQAAETSLIFVNTRSQAEMLFQDLWAVNADGLAIALHHGSLAKEQRRKVEAAMIRGQLRALVCTSTLDLGVDWGNVDQVIQMGAPKGAARLMQRIGRANHRMDETSRAVLVPTNRFEILECEAARTAIADGEIDGQGQRLGGLDVLAQHIMGRACGDGFDSDVLYAEIGRAAPYAGLTRETFDRVLDFVATGGYALKTYDRFKRIVRRRNGLWVARTKRDIQQHRMNIGAIVEARLLTVRMVRKSRSAVQSGDPMAGRVAGKKLGEIEEYFVSSLKAGDTFIFAGQVLCFVAVRAHDALVVPAAAAQDPAVPSYNGGKFPLTTFLAARVREMIYDQTKWSALPEPAQDWLKIQKLRSGIPSASQLLVETFSRGNRHYLVTYPFEGRLAHQTLGMLITRRLERLGKQPLGFVASEYALAVWALKPLGDLDLSVLFHSDLLGDDLEEWLDESVLMKRHFSHCALISGLVAQRLPGQEKTGRQVTFSTDLIYDVLRSHQPDHILLEAARQDAATGFLDIWRLSEMLARVSGMIVHKALVRISPFAVPLMLEIGKEPVRGHSASEDILRDAEEQLVREAMR
ncbi:MAG: DNA ligase-associated DEXH box helicase [Hyphomonadaceae bacterium]|nr:DNA ligase-associated DEXH box helicase [Hyphomonadaceae bacterium]OUX93144.1 MAG: DNA ligase-associated DEXH box helicase [Hyphomonas sp. TMED17]